MKMADGNGGATAQSAWAASSKDAWLCEFPRVKLVQSSTPLEFMGRLTDELGGSRFYVKRDDTIGFAMGGNKVRQMEFYFGDVLASGADTVISTSAVQSNHLRVLAATAAKFGLACEIQHEDRVAGMGAEYRASGNALLQRLFGANIRPFPLGEDEAAADAELEGLASRLRANGRSPYVISMGPGHPHLGALGYVDAARELLEQTAEQGIEIDAIVLPTGSAATHAGMLVGMRAHGHGCRIFGICVRRDRVAQEQRVWQRARETADLIGLPDVVRREDIFVTDKYLGSGYGQPMPETVTTIRQLARLEGLLLDPVYSGKAMAGLIGLARSGVLKQSWNVIFVHTGGLPALFAYGTLLDG